ncbi:MAG: amidohydrolase family protein, partial [Deltaproteobacteria bacterium]|nr:amidohydrolase family protein [Deltaproteobacteria bacterium]
MRADWLVDGLGGPPVKAPLVEARRGVIQRVASGEAPPPGAEVRELSGHTLLPGLVDAHVHLAMSGEPDPAIRETQLDMNYPAAKRVIRENLVRMAAWGIVAARDAGDRRGHVSRYLSKRGGASLPAVVASGRAWHALGRYGKMIGRSPEPGRSLARGIEADCEPRGVVKIIQSGINSLDEYRRQTPPQFSLPELCAAVDAARACGLSVMAHANGEEPVAIAVAAGVASVEHGFFMGEGNLAAMAKKGTVWVPTAVTMDAYARVLPPESPQRDMALRLLNHQLEQLAKAREVGVAVATGTDAGSPGVIHGPALAREMRLFMDAGYTLAEAVAAA